MRVLRNFLHLVAVVPEVRIDGAPKQFVVVGNEIQLTCRYNTSPPASEVQWLKDGIVISRNASMENASRGNITHFNESLVQLTVHSSTPQDAGNYTCLVINSVDNSSDTTEIVIQGLLTFSPASFIIFHHCYERHPIIRDGFLGTSHA